MRVAYMLSSVLLLGLLTQLFISVSAQSEESEIEIFCEDAYGIYVDPGTPPEDFGPDTYPPHGIAMCELSNPTDQQQSGIISYHTLGPISLLSAPVSFDLDGGEVLDFYVNYTAPDRTLAGRWIYSVHVEVTHIEESECSNCADDWWSFEVPIWGYYDWELTTDDVILLTMRPGESIIVPVSITNSGNIATHFQFNWVINGSEEEHGVSPPWVFQNRNIIVDEEDSSPSVGVNETVVYRKYEITANIEACKEDYLLPWQSLEQTMYVRAGEPAMREDSQWDSVEVIASIDCSLNPVEEVDGELPAPTVVISILAILIAALRRSRPTF